MCRIFVLILFFASQILTAQNPEVLHSTTKEIHIVYNHSVVIPWHLDASVNPDIFHIGSTLSKKSVQFISDIDSIYFIVETGQQYDFIIQLASGELCHTRVDALKDPYFLNHRGWIALVLIMVVPGIYLFRNRRAPIKNALPILGIGIPGLFWGNTILSGRWHGQYSHIKNTISTLGQIGSASEIFVAVISLLICILCILFSSSFYLESRRLNLSVWPALLSYSMAYSMGWVAFFPLGHEMHGNAGPVPIVMMVAVLLSIFLWKGKLYKSLRIWSCISLGTMSLLFLRFIPTLQNNFEGLIQRFFWLGWSIWFVAIGIYINQKKEII